jgi:hypothetical protein
MRDVYRRIALHGALTAIVLGILGFMLAELASIWLAGSPGTRSATGAPVEGTDTQGAVGANLRARVPLLMAAWGFGFVAVGELLLHWWRSRRKPVAAKPPEPDPAEKLLEELLAQAEAQRTGDRGQGTEVSDQTPAAGEAPATDGNSAEKKESVSPTG